MTLRKKARSCRCRRVGWSVDHGDSSIPLALELWWGERQGGRLGLRQVFSRYLGLETELGARAWEQITLLEVATKGWLQVGIPWQRRSRCTQRCRLRDRESGTVLLGAERLQLFQICDFVSQVVFFLDGVVVGLGFPEVFGSKLSFQKEPLNVALA